MSDPTSIDFDQLSQCYLRHQAYNPPSELHGLLAGRLCTGTRLQPGEWLSVAGEHMDVEQLRPLDADAVISPLYGTTLNALESNGLEFEPLLPGDDYAMAERCEALGHWCRGFLEGFALTLKPEQRTLSDESQEIMQDLVAISQVELDANDGEDNERHLFELTEYVRTAAMNLFLEFNAPPASEQTTLH